MWTQLKLSGGSWLLCGVVCVTVTVTTTVVHMNRLQTLRECVYDAAAQACTCFSMLHPPAESIPMPLPMPDPDSQPQGIVTDEV
ncbi:unnamed protein product [Darwinula stevensoni]|uniref:Uncharacterized protein n=1 Tax=Darwinula stevensoni TaxID=69355 RepID=A0A7R9AHT9_9CRUS|nr:unnamed protein product [Darwinula stevensoni]CAG0906009.1 unnamed protein product [Darwinula stevensoni]